jgi:hypothetical protein
MIGPATFLRSLRVIRLMYGAVIIMAGCVSGSSELRAATLDPPLYVIKLDPVKKGYIESNRKSPDGKVAFRECGASNVTFIDRNNLKETTGTCLQVVGPWRTFTGAIIQVSPNGSVKIQTLSRDTFELSAADWAAGFQKQPEGTNADQQPPAPKVGAFVGGLMRDKAEELYIIDAARPSPNT